MKSIIDINNNFFKVGELDYVNNKLLINSLHIIPLLNDFLDSSLSQDFDNILSTIKSNMPMNIKNRNVNIVIPDDYSYFQIIEMPLLTEKELISAIKYQAEQFIPLPIEQTSLDLQIIYEDKKNKKCNVFVVAADKKIIDLVVNLIEGLGLIPETIENETSSIIRFIDFFYYQFKNKIYTSDYYLFLNLGYKNITFLLYSSFKNLIKEILTLPVGYQMFIKEINLNYNKATNESLKIFENLNNEETKENISLKQTLQYSFNYLIKEIKNSILLLENKYNTKIESCFILGEGVRNNYLTTYLTKNLQINCQTFPFDFLFQNTMNFEKFKNSLPILVSLFGASLR